MNYLERLNKLQQAMHKESFDGLIYSTGPNFRYFTGVPVKWRREQEPTEPDCLLIAARNTEPRVIVPASATHLAEKSPVNVSVVDSPEQVVDILDSLLPDGRIGTGPERAECYLTELAARAQPEADICSGQHVGEKLRYCKDEKEIEVLRRAAAMCDEVMEEIVDHIRPGITQTRLEEMIAEVGTSLGAEDVSFSPTAAFVKSDTEPTDQPFVYPKDEGLVPGTSIAFDFGFVLEGYCSDFGRSFYCGPAPDHISGAYRALQESQCQLIQRMGPDEMTVSELFDTIEEALDERDYGDRLRARLPGRGLGHQIGVDLHENPRLNPEWDDALQPGMTMAIEPKLWLPGEYYLRVEDIVLITEEGTETFTTFDRELFELPL